MAEVENTDGSPNNEELLKQIADLRLENQSLRESQNQEPAPEEAPAPINTPQTTVGFDVAESNMVEQTPAQNTELEAVKAEVEALRKKDEVNTFAEENNLTNDHKRMIQEGVEKGLSLEDASIFAQGKMSAGGNAIGTPTPPQSESQHVAEEEKANQPTDPRDMSTEELERQAEAELEAADRAGTPIQAVV